MAVSTNEIISTLNDLIETCKDGENGFREAANGVQDTTMRSFFQDCSMQRAKFASELQAEVTRLGGKAETSGSMLAAAHRGWIDIKSAVTGKDEHAILEECERGEDVAVREYQKAMAKDMPSDLRSIIQRQASEVKQCHDRVRTLRDTSKAGMRTQTGGSTLPY